ncbi:GH3 auxin-responsive promoter family protein [Spirosoma rhododendri]|uniref:GH3 auxin-responsive promoter family protein n=1 Tax=Spirosoma rhododendri TaxID=2728024 RepID=A0A7L5DIB3_9BACT|nr:GH3 auxin-responsive promoter family protein [Spirosoma rhododendri]QJD78106.1 GH3 auxin-responsive promoter family protein [Spirosoma rhododendri]
MTLLNTTLKWLLQRRLPRIEAMMKDPGAVQQRTFSQLIRSGTRTEWGKQHQYKSIRSVADFQRQVPISSYEDLFPYIERVMMGESKVLWPSPVRWFAKSSGTTNARSKFIPVTPESLDEGHFKGGKDMMALYVANHPDSRTFDGKGLSIGGSLQGNPYAANSAAGDVSAVVMKNLPSWAQFIRTPSVEVALMDEWESKLDRMADITKDQNVTSMLGAPTWGLVLIDKILARTGKQNILEVWPNFELLVHGAVNFQPYRDLFRQQVFPSESVRYQEVYNASEGFFAIQDDMGRPGEMLLMLDYGIFYEFVPIAESNQPYPKALTIDEVELDQNYALIVSTNGGLWRYRVGDTVRFTSLYPHRLKVSGRTKHFINAFGEEMIVENAEVAVTRACEATGAVIADYTAGPVYMGNGTSGCHEWIIEFAQEPVSMSRFEQILDQTLREINSDYDAKRYNDFVLRPPRIHVVPRGTFYTWMKQRGKLGGQHKVPRLANTREYLDDILGRVLSR